MVELVTAIRDYAAWLYALLLALAVRELMAVRRAGKERRRAMFSLEREAATSRAVRSLIILLLLFTIAAGVYTTAEVIAPTLPDATLPAPSLPLAPVPTAVPATWMPPVTRVPSPRLPIIVTATPPAPLVSGTDES